MRTLITIAMTDENKDNQYETSDSNSQKKKKHHMKKNNVTKTKFNSLSKLFSLVFSKFQVEKDSLVCCTSGNNKVSHINKFP